AMFVVPTVSHAKENVVVQNHTYAIEQGEENGAMVPHWSKYGGSWYYFNEDGNTAKDWKKIVGTWYFFGKDGIMVTDLKTINKKTYYFN
ncbi:glucan-binding protein, partial [Bacillus pseudomycoides]